MKALAWAALPALIAGLAVAQPGYPVDAVDLNDASVWVTNLASDQRKVARYNAAIEELTGGFTIAPEEGDFDVVQAGSKVAIAQGTGFRTVELAELKLSDLATYPPTQEPPPGFARLAVGGDAVLLASADLGQIWLRRFADAASLDPAAVKPDLTLGAGRVVIAPDGNVFAVAEDGRITRAWLDGGSGPPARQDLGRIALPSGQINAVTAVGGRAYVLVQGVLVGLDGSVDLSSYGGVEDLQLQTPIATGDGVAVATSEALLLVDPRGEVTEWRTGNVGRAAVPVAVGECVHAAWAASADGGDNYLATCGGELSVGRALEGVGPDSRIVFRVNRQVVVLNDVQDGRVWMPSQDGRVRDRLNWDQIDPKPEESPDQDHTASDDRQPECDDKSAKPLARDDEYGVRPGASVVAMVLGNDSATSCGALAISRIGLLDLAQGRAELVLGGRGIQFTPEPGVGAASFTYTLSDANGQTDSANVHISVDASANRAPSGPAEPPRMAAELGASATYRALADFVDPDGDPMRLVSATTSDQAVRLSFQADGAVTVRDLGGSPRPVQISLTVADTRGAVAAPLALTVDFREAGTLVPTADPVVGHGLVKDAVTVDLRDSLRTAHVRPLVFALETGPAPLTEATVDPDTGILTFRASAPNTYSVPVTVRSGTLTAQVPVRMDIEDGGDARVVAVQDAVYVRPGLPALIDPLVNDVAEGGVPVLAGLDVPPDVGIEVVPVGRQYLEISSAGTAIAGGGSVDVSYTVSVGGVTATGLISVVQAGPGPNQDPLVLPKDLQVRAGGVVTIPVLEQSSDPDGDALMVAVGAPIRPSPACGTVYASVRSVRYLAPETPCPKPVSVAVPVVDDSGGSSLGVFAVRVHSAEARVKAPPRPRDLVARVWQGEEVKIPVPLTGIDPDGDGVSLQQGLDTYPRSGTVTEIGPDFITYRAGPDQLPGTDTFTYAVEDWASNRATAQVTVGVAAPGQAGGGVVAQDDKATARPGKELEIPVLANDVDLSGQDRLVFCADRELGLSSPDLMAYADPVRGRLIVTLPDQPGQYQVVYYACGGSGGADSASVNLTVDPEAAVAPPRAKDIVSPPHETIDKASVDINVSQWAYNPSGPSSDLELFLPEESSAHAAVKNESEVTVQLQPQLPTIIFYGLRNRAPDADGVTAYGSITVPPISRPPYLRPAPGPVRAVAGQELVAVLDEFVAVAKGRAGAFLFEPANPGNLAAGHGEVAPAKDGRGIAYTADGDFAGLDRIEFWVADGASTSDSGLKKSKLWLDVMVLPGGEPVVGFTDPAPRVERGALTPHVVDLADFTLIDGLSPDAPNDLSVQLGAVTLPGLSVNQKGTAVSILASAGPAVGDRATIPVTLAYGGGRPRTGLAITVTVTETKQPAVKPNPPSVVKAERGRPETVPVLEGVFDPWAKSRPARLRDLAVTGDATAQVVGQSVAVTVNSAKDNANVAVSFLVEDGLGRLQAGAFTVIARDRPDPPAQVAAVPAERGWALVSWTPVTGRAANGEPVEAYRVVLSGADCEEAGAGAASARCRGSGLVYGGQYRAQVYARNAVGESAEPGMATLDYEVAPDSPREGEAAAGKNQISLNWTPPAPDGGSVSYYTVMCDGAVMGGTIQATHLTLGDVAGGVSYSCSVAAVNRKGSSVPLRLNSVTPYGEPGQPARPRVTWRDERSVTVTWEEVSGAGAGVAYSLLVNGQPQDGCANTSCAVRLDPGQVAKFEVMAQSLKPDGGSKLSDPAGPFRQPPGRLEPLVAPVIAWTWRERDTGTDSSSGLAQGDTPGGTVGGAAELAVTWPRYRVPAGFVASPEWYFDGQRIASGQTVFTGLGAGIHTAKVRYCLNSGDGIGLVPGVPASGICVESPEARVVIAKPEPKPEAGLQFGAYSTISVARLQTAAGHGGSTGFGAVPDDKTFKETYG
ncbi:MAG: hypothetical protein LBJ02_03510 [Bifidobacteriaceae bacterium]|jgi:hypothetical protein|nr:hypothetical protein [Bifidobacteriaceae bacterium]